MIGVILLIGIVKKNGILIVDLAIAETREGAAPDEAITRACALRFRPILVTTAAAVLTCIPLMLCHGIDAETERAAPWHRFRTCGNRLTRAIATTVCLTARRRSCGAFKTQSGLSSRDLI